MLNSKHQESSVASGSVVKLIGLHGKAGSGKDFSANILLNEFGHRRYAFADQLKLAVRAMVGEDAYLWMEAHKEEDHPVLGVSLRKAAQELGMLGRHLSPTMWLRHVQESMDRDGDEAVVLTDVRFDNEAEFVRSAGGEVWEVIASNRQSVRSHASEDGISIHLIDKTIFNAKDDQLVGEILKAATNPVAR